MFINKLKDFWAMVMRNKTLLVLLIIQLVISVFIAYQVNDIRDNTAILKTLGEAADSGNNAEEEAEPTVITDINTKDDPFKGDENAPVTIVEFSDFQCPYCSRFFEQILPSLQEEYIDTGKVKFVYKDFPLKSIHSLAQKSAEAAECADEQGKFWEYHDLLYGNQDEWTEGGVETFKQYAADLGLDTDKFNSCLDNGDMQAEVDEDYEDSLESGGRGTPYFVINGIPLSGAQPFANFKAIIDAELQ